MFHKAERQKIYDYNLPAGQQLGGDALLLLTIIALPGIFFTCLCVTLALPLFMGNP